MSVVGMAHVLRSRLVMDYATSYFTLIVLGYPYTQKSAISTLALKLSVSPPLGDCHTEYKQETEKLPQTCRIQQINCRLWT